MWTELLLDIVSKHLSLDPRRLDYTRWGPEVVASPLFAKVIEVQEFNVVAPAGLIDVEQVFLVVIR